jgi:uncharacterized RDD family membrane protein YckC
MARCDSCGGSVPANMVVQLGSRMVCTKCKDRVAREMAGAAPVARLRYAGFWIRFVAYIVDGILLNVVNTIIGLPFGITPFSSDVDPAKAGMVLFVSFIQIVVGILYYTIFVGKAGATPGKMALGLKIVRSDGSPVGFGRACGRYFSYILSALIFAIGFLMIAFSDEKKGLHDIVCDTRVVYK